MSKIDEILKPISLRQTQAYVGKYFQLYNVLEWVLKQTGEADVTVVTFSTSEEFIRKVFRLKKDGLISKCEIILDFKASQKTNKLLRFMGNVFDSVRYAKTHAKIILIEPTEKTINNVCISGSQNTTRGNRNESIIISRDPDIYFQLHYGVENIKSMQYDIHGKSVGEN